VPPELAQAVAAASELFAALDIAEIAEAAKRPLAEVIDVHCGIGARLGMARLHAQIEALPGESYWQSLSKTALADDLAGLQRSISLDVVSQGGGDAAQLLAAWERRNSAELERSQRLLAELGDTKSVDLAMLSVALRELRNLA
jgi:glutamate dehydrogenase